VKNNCDITVREIGKFKIVFIHDWLDPQRCHMKALIHNDNICRSGFNKCNLSFCSCIAVVGVLWALWEGKCEIRLNRH
jgi:hypothetical protein